jgi:uncharacterized protein (TIGR02265 family)
MISRPLAPLRLAPQTFRCFTGIRRLDAGDSWEQLRERIAQTPSDAMVRGMFLSELLRSAPGSGVESRRYIPFTFYPVREYMDLILRVAQGGSQKLSPATAVMRVGFGVYSLFAASLAGTAIFSIAREFQRVVELSPRAYVVTLKSSTVEVVKAEQGAAIVRLSGVWPYPDIFHAGIWLGAMEAFHADGEIAVTRYSLSEVELDMRWSKGVRP